MDGRGGECCVARYAYDSSSKIDRIMLRFRPIAPKPVSSGSGSGGSSPEKNVSLVKTSRVKRRYVKDGSKRCNSGRKRRVVPEQRTNQAVVPSTLPLLPEKPDPTLVRSTVVNDPFITYLPIWLRSDRQLQRVLTPQPVRPVGSCVVVECVTDTCTGDVELLLGSTDEEKMMKLEKDTCPGFVSDGSGKVRWTNEAYRNMVNQEEEGEGRRRPEIVWLVVKERLPEMCESFTCMVRLQYTCQKEKNSLTVPCDVWKMAGGGFAWRLDVKAALSLGR